MKGFISTYVLCYVVCAIFIFFIFGWIYNNLWAMLAVICLPIAVMLQMFLHYEKRIDALEKRIEELERMKFREQEKME